MIAEIGLSIFLDKCFNLVKLLIDIKDIRQVQAVASQLRTELLEHQREYVQLLKDYESLQMGYNALAKEHEDTEDELAKEKARSEDFDRYALVLIGKTFPAYALKESCARGEPAHLLCPDCFAKRMKGFFSAVDCGNPYGAPQVFVKCLNCERASIIPKADYDNASRYA